MRENMSLCDELGLHTSLVTRYPVKINTDGLFRVRCLGDNVQYVSWN